MDKLNIKDIQKFKTLNYHTSYIMCVLILNDGRLSSSSDDCSIIIYEKNTFLPEIEILDFDTPINNIIQLSNNYLVSACADGKITVIKLISNTEYKIISSLLYHNFSVNRIIELNENEFASGSDDQTVKIFKKYDNYDKIYQCIMTLANLSAPIEAIIYCKKLNEIILAPYKEQNLQFWNLLFYQKICNLNNIYFEGFQNSLVMINDYILGVGVFAGLNLIDLKTHNIFKRIKIVGGVLNVIKKNNFLFTNGVFKGNNNSIIKWEIKDNEIIKIGEKHKLINENNEHNNHNHYHLERLIILKVFDDGTIVIATSENKIELWKN